MFNSRLLGRATYQQRAKSTDDKLVKSHSLSAFCSESIQIPHSSIQAYMAKEKADLYDIHAIFQPVGSFGMAELVGVGIQRNLQAPFVGVRRIYFYLLVNRRLCQFYIFSPKRE